MVKYQRKYLKGSGDQMTQQTERYWADIATQIVHGEYLLTISDLKAIAHRLKFKSMKPKFFPADSLGDTNLKTRRRSIKALVKNVWGLTESKLLVLEHDWLKDIREETGSSLNDDKEEFRDLVAPQILARIYVTAFLFYRLEKGDLKKVKPEVAYLITNQAVYSLNIFLINAVFKGWSRANKIQVEDKEEIVYNFFVQRGLPVGSSGLFLPNPEVSLPYLFSLLSSKAVLRKVYK